MADIGRLKKEFRNSKKPLVIVTGCVAQAESDEMLRSCLLYTSDAADE